MGGETDKNFLLTKISGSTVYLAVNVSQIIFKTLRHMQLLLPDSSPLYHYECCRPATLSQASQSVHVCVIVKTT